MVLGLVLLPLHLSTDFKKIYACLYSEVKLRHLSRHSVQRLFLCNAILLHYIYFTNLSFGVLVDKTGG